MAQGAATGANMAILASYGNCRATPGSQARCARMPAQSVHPFTGFELLDSRAPRFPGLPMARTNPAAAKTIPANAENRYEVTQADLPLSCPMPGMSLWNSHPKVYLPIEDEGGESVCAYCGARYVLKA